mmetsp:Transcript_16359/g.45051  ORF Transcript_16359/g.45051 Transcript_16359/m.45051 type:complete len:275 (+) Transcript_16359:1268-2092(+)
MCRGDTKCRGRACCRRATKSGRRCGRAAKRGRRRGRGHCAKDRGGGRGAGDAERGRGRRCSTKSRRGSRSGRAAEGGCRCSCGAKRGRWRGCRCAKSRRAGPTKRGCCRRRGTSAEGGCGGGLNGGGPSAKRRRRRGRQRGATERKDGSGCRTGCRWRAKGRRASSRRAKRCGWCLGGGDWGWGRHTADRRHEGRRWCGSRLGPHTQRATGWLGTRARQACSSRRTAGGGQALGVLGGGVGCCGGCLCGARLLLECIQLPLLRLHLGAKPRSLG